MKKILAALLCVTTLFGNNIKVENIDTTQLHLEQNNFKILNLGKRVETIRLSQKDIVFVSFIENTQIPLSKIKVMGKKKGVVSSYVKFADNTSSQINISVSTDLREVSAVISLLDKNVSIEEINGSVILKGYVKNNKVKKQIIETVTQSLADYKVVDLMELDSPDKMVKLRLYVAEINNDEGEEFKNNWTVGFNDGKTTSDVSTDMLKAVTLSGGLTAAATNLGNKFDVSWTLNYLKNNGVAKILDETTLVTLEQNDSKFLAGGTFYVQSQGTTQEGQIIQELQEVNYGLEMNINVNDIIQDKYVELVIDTSSSSLDQTTAVNGIPGKKDKSVKTKVILKDDQTLVLGGLINKESIKDYEGIPIISDIPVLGKLFESENFQQGKSELIFFITPTIVNVEKENNQDKLNKMIDNTRLSNEKKQYDENGMYIIKAGEDLSKKENFIKTNIKPNIQKVKQAPVKKESFTKDFPKYTPSKQEVVKEQTKVEIKRGSFTKDFPKMKIEEIKKVEKEEIKKTSFTKDFPKMKMFKKTVPVKIEVQKSSFTKDFPKYTPSKEEKQPEKPEVKRTDLLNMFKKTQPKQESDLLKLEKKEKLETNFFNW